MIGGKIAGWEKCIILLSRTIGLLYLYQVCDFIAQLEIMNDILTRWRWMPPSIAILFILISGMSMVLGGLFLLDENIKQETINISLVYGGILVGLFVYLIVGPRKTCQCTNYHESLIRVSDWSNVEIALLILILSTLLFIMYYIRIQRGKEKSCIYNFCMRKKAK